MKWNKTGGKNSVNASTSLRKFSLIRYPLLSTEGWFSGLGEGGSRVLGNNRGLTTYYYFQQPAWRLLLFMLNENINMKINRPDPSITTKNENETPKEEVFKPCLSSEIIRGKGTFWYYLSRQDCIRSCLRNNKVKEKYRTKIDKSTENLNVCERRNLVLTNIHKLKAIHSIQ